MWCVFWSPPAFFSMEAISCHIPSLSMCVSKRSSRADTVSRPSWAEDRRLGFLGEGLGTGMSTCRVFAFATGSSWVRPGKESKRRCSNICIIILDRLCSGHVFQGRPNCCLLALFHSKQPSLFQTLLCNCLFLLCYVFVFKTGPLISEHIPHKLGIRVTLATVLLIY